MHAFSSGAAAARRRPVNGLLYLVTSGLLWGTGGLTGSLLARATGLSAIAVAACRLTVGGILIVVFLTVTGRRCPAGRAAWVRILVIGLLAALYQACYFTAVALTSVPLATLVTIGAAPVIVLAADRLAGRPAGRLAAVATALAVTGLGLLVGVPSGFRETAVLASAGMAVLAAAGFAAITLTGARPVAGLDDLTVTGFGFTLGGLALMPLAQLAGGLGFRPSPAALGLLVALGTGPTAVAYTLYFRGLRAVAASTAALLTLLEPLTGAILAALVLGERLSATGIAGAAVIGAAVILAVRADRSRPARRREDVTGRAARVGGDDGGDAQPLLKGQRLAQDHQAGERGQHRVDAHADPEVAGRYPAQRQQVGEERHGRGQDPRAGCARQRGRRRRMPDQQAAASRTLASLENALGVRLLRRTTREVTLTAAGRRVLAPARRALAAAEDVVREAAAGPALLRTGYAWSAMGRHTTAFQRRWAAEHPGTELQLIRTNSSTAGLAEGACDIAVIRTEPDQRRFRDAVVGLERRYCAMAADDPWATRRSLRLAEIGERVLVIDRRTGTTTPDLWLPGAGPAIEYTGDIDDWLTAIASGRYVGVTPESTVTQYPRPGIVYRPLRDAPPVPVRLVWWRDDAHPATAAAVGLLTSLFRGS